MAARRGVGGSLTAISAGMAPLLQMIMSDRMQRQRMQEEKALELSNQLSVEKQGMEDLLATRSIEKPDFASRLYAAGKTDVSGIPTEALLPGEQDLSKPVSSSIQAAKTLPDVPTPQDVMQQRLGQGPIGWPITPDGTNTPSSGTEGLTSIQNLMAQRQAKENALKPFEPVTKVESYDPTTATKQTQFTPNSQLAGLGKVQEEANPTQVGQNKVAEARAGEFSPDYTKLKTSSLNALESGTRAEKVRTAGGIASAQASAQQAAEWLNPAIIKAKVDFETQKGLAENLKKGRADQAKLVAESGNTIIGIMPDITKMQQLSAKVNVFGASQFLRRGGQAMGAMTQMAPDAAELNRIGANISKRLANDPFFGGNKGAQSEKDSEAILGRLPTAGDSKEIADRMIASFNKNLFDVIQAVNALPPETDPLVRINSARRAFGLEEWNPLGGSGSADPNRSILQQQLENMRKR